MNDFENKINNMLPSDLIKVKKLIDILLDYKINNTRTNLEYLKKSKTIECDINPNHRVKKNGKKDGVQRYYCNDCKKSIPLTKNTILEHLKLTYNQLKILLRCMYDYKSLTEISLEIGLCRTSVFELQIRIFSALEIIHNDEILEGIVQVDEKYERTSFKGFPKEKMPRCSRYNGKDNHISGISNDQVCIIVAIDEKDHLIIKVVGNGPASTNMINKALENRIKKNSILVTDSKGSYIDFAHRNNLKLIQIPEGNHKYKNYHINDVNEIMTEISELLIRKRGVSSRHLQHYMNFIRYRKIIKYTIEYLEINEKMYNDLILLVPKLKSDDVYTSELPFDTNKYKEWFTKYN